MQNVQQHFVTRGGHNHKNIFLVIIIIYRHCQRRTYLSIRKRGRKETVTRVFVYVVAVVKGCGIILLTHIIQPCWHYYSYIWLRSWALSYNLTIVWQHDIIFVALLLFCQKAIFAAIRLGSDTLQNVLCDWEFLLVERALLYLLGGILLAPSRHWHQVYWMLLRNIIFSQWMKCCWEVTLIHPLSSLKIPSNFSV